jgi:DNA ligase (NAD+)
VLELDRLRAEKNKEGADAVGQRLIASGFAQPSKKAKAEPRDAVVEVGPVVARAVVEWFDSERGRTVIERLRQLGISPRGKSGSAAAGDHPFAGKTLVLTGTLHEITRGAATERIRAAGGNVSSSVSKKTDFLVVGESAGSKLDEARKHGVKELSEAEFLAMLGGASAAGDRELFGT